MSNTYSIYNNDSYEQIKEFKRMGLKVNHIITDPPYDISKKNNFHTLANRHGIDFGEWDKDFDLYSWIKEYGELIDKNGSFIIFCSYRFLSYICDCLEENGFEVKDLLEWEKSNPMPRNTNRRYVQDKEFAIWAVKKNAKWTFNKDENYKYLRSTFKYPIVQGKERFSHPTQKSIKLMEDIIKIHTNPNDTILDPFMGTGTTGEASLNLGRNFIGVELSKDYFKIVEDRLEKKGEKI